jgi:ABC-type sugar transport system permease subunit
LITPASRSHSERVQSTRSPLVVQRRSTSRVFYTDKSSLFLLPSALVLGSVMIYPLLYAFYLSLFHYNIGSGTRSLIGLSNYSFLLGDTRFWQSLTRTAGIVATAVGLEFCLGLLIAYGLYQLKYGTRALIVFLLMPNIITPVASALFLRWFFMPDFGLINVVLMNLSVSPPDWFGDASWARLTIVLADAWQQTPFVTLVLFAGMNTVDQSITEAARIDGAGTFKLLFRIMVPSIRPLILFVLAIRLMDSFRFFDQIFVLTAGGPGTATETLTMYTYTSAFRLLEIGEASALGVLTLLILMAITILLIRFMYREERGAF